MRLEELPDDLQEAITSLKHGSLSIEADVIEALATAENLRDFKERASGAADPINSMQLKVK